MQWSGMSRYNIDILTKFLFSIQVVQYQTPNLQLTVYGQSGYLENARYPVALGLLRTPGRKQLKKKEVVSVQELPLLPINVTPSNAPVAL